MDPMDRPEPRRDAEIENFWLDARVHAHLNRLGILTGENALAALRPPAWAFGSSPEQADRLLAAVLDGRKTATASALWDYQVGREPDGPAESDESDEGREPLPEVGAMSIVLDGEGHPRALIVTTAVEVVPFDQVDADHARAEGEGDLSLDGWRRVHQEFFAENTTHDPSFSPDMPVVLERFSLLHPQG